VCRQGEALTNCGPLAHARVSIARATGADQHLHGAHFTARRYIASDNSGRANIFAVEPKKLWVSSPSRDAAAKSGLGGIYGAARPARAAYSCSKARSTVCCPVQLNALLSLAATCCLHLWSARSPAQGLLGWALPRQRCCLLRLLWPRAVAGARCEALELYQAGLLNTQQ